MHAHDDGVSTFFARRVFLRAGSNHCALSMQTLYLQVLDVVNETNLEDADLRTLLGFSFTYPDFATDMQPDMARVVEATRRHVRESFGLDELDYVGIARGVGSPGPDTSGTVRVMLYPEGEWLPEVPWTTCEGLAKSGIPQVRVARDYTLGELEVDASYTVLARPLTEEGVPALMAFGFRPSEAGSSRRSLPVGEYLLEPSNDNMLILPERSRRVEVSSDQPAKVSFADAVGHGRLRVSVTDAGGRPLAGCVIRIVGTEIGGYRAVRPPDGAVDMLVEAGEYQVTVRTPDNETVHDRLYKIDVGSELVLPLRLDG